MDPFIGEIRVFGFGYVPVDWAACDGSTVLVAQYQALYALIGTKFGGTPNTNFMLPNLAGRSMCGAGNGLGLTPRPVGQAFGSNQVTLGVSNLAPHTHPLPVYDGGTRTPAPTPTSALSTSDGSAMYALANLTTPIAYTTPAGGGQPHENRQPWLAMNLSIALVGDFPVPAD
jgi:microcystin-dependent protein